jgi:hypothetical protein
MAARSRRSDHDRKPGSRQSRADALRSAKEDRLCLLTGGLGRL